VELHVGQGLLGHLQCDLGGLGAGQGRTGRQGGGLQGGLCGPQVGLGVLQCLDRPGAPGDQVPLAGVVPLGPLDGHAGLGHRGDLRDVEVLVGHLLQAELGQVGQELPLGLPDRQLGVDRLHPHQQFARLDPVPDVVDDLDDPPRPLRADGHALPALERAGHLDGPLDRPVLQRDDGHRHRPGRGAGLDRLLRPVGAARRREQSNARPIPRIRSRIAPSLRSRAPRPRPGRRRAEAPEQVTHEATRQAGAQVHRRDTGSPSYE
jgi:hypothetical protein